MYIGTTLTSAQVANHYALGGGGGTTTNNPPTASFTQTASGLKVSVDGSASTDSDGTIATYSWNWGDGTTTAGQTSSHTYASAGTKTVVLTVTDNGGATGTSSQQISVSSTNSAPTAAFTSTTNGLSVSVDGSSSTDSDGTIASYAWNFGETGSGNNTATGATASHTYAAAGTYTVTLTVTDDGGLTNTATKSVTVTSGTTTTIAQDGFTRTVAAGSLGSADTGGAYTLSGTASRYSVDGTAAELSSTAGSTKKALLNSTSSSDTDITATIKLSALSVGGSTYGELIGRSISGDDYRARVVIGASGSVQIIAAHGMTSLKSATVSGLTYTAGDTLQVRLQVFGTSPTTVQARVWKTTGTEPTTWQVSTTDNTAALQGAGSVGFGSYAGSGVTNGPVTVYVDNLLAVPDRELTRQTLLTAPRHSSRVPGRGAVRGSPTPGGSLDPARHPTSRSASGQEASRCSGATAARSVSVRPEQVGLWAAPSIVNA